MYHVLYTDGGALVGVTTEDALPLHTVSVIDFEGDVPDLNKVTWDKTYLKFVSSTTVYTKFEFLSKFTSEERIAIRTSTDPVVQDFIHMLEVSEQIDVSNTTTIDGINYLESINLLTNNRATEILS
jgi:hypothetical protein